MILNLNVLYFYYFFITSYNINGWFIVTIDYNQLFELNANCFEPLCYL